MLDCARAVQCAVLAAYFGPSVNIQKRLSRFYSFSIQSVMPDLIEFTDLIESLSSTLSMGEVHPRRVVIITVPFAVNFESQRGQKGYLFISL